MFRRGAVEDLVNRACRNVFGAAITYTPKGGSPVSIDANGDPLAGIFDSSHVTTLTDVDGGEVSDRRPMLEIVLDDVAGLFDPQPGDEISITSGPSAGGVYTVVDVEPDAAQAVMLILVEGSFV